MDFVVFIDNRAILDIQEAINFYDNQQPGLGKRFESVLNEHIIILMKTPLFRKRYDNVRCFPLKKFPYMIHFTVNEKEKIVIIRAVFHTSKNPNTWKRN